jgi:hypothetical protein
VCSYVGVLCGSYVCVFYRIDKFFQTGFLDAICERASEMNQVIYAGVCGCVLLLCFVVCVVLCFVLLCFVVLCCVVVCGVVLCCSVWCGACARCVAPFACGASRQDHTQQRHTGALVYSSFLSFDRNHEAFLTFITFNQQAHIILWTTTWRKLRRSPNVTVIITSHNLRHLRDLLIRLDAAHLAVFEKSIANDIQRADGRRPQDAERDSPRIARDKIKEDADSS